MADLPLHSPKPRPSLDLRKALERAAAQFRALDLREPGQWPVLPRGLAWGSMVLLVFGLAWLAFVSDTASRLKQLQTAELTLKEEYRAKLARAANLPELRKQKVRLEEFVRVAMRLLPDKTEMDAMLSNIGQARLGRGLTLEQFKPEQEVPHSEYVEIPITLRVTGSYHSLGSFAADVASLPRIVALQELKVAVPTPKPAAPLNDSTVLTFEAKVRAYRYADLQVAAPAQAASRPPGRPGPGQPPAKPEAGLEVGRPPALKGAK